jgi:hypothetical protein
VRDEAKLEAAVSMRWPEDTLSLARMPYFRISAPDAVTVWWPRSE